MLARSRMESKYDICDNTVRKGDTDKSKPLHNHPLKGSSFTEARNNKTQNKQIGIADFNLDLVGVGHFFPGSVKCSI